MRKPRILSEVVFIDAPPETVWDLYDDPAKVATWAPSVLSGEIEGGGEKRLGARIRWKMKMSGFKMKLVEEVVGYEPPRRSVLRGSSPGMGYEMVFEVAPDGKGTRCQYDCVATYRGLLRLLAPVMDAMNRGMLKDALGKLKVAAEKKS